MFIVHNKIHNLILPILNKYTTHSNLIITQHFHIHMILFNNKIINRIK